MGFWSRVGDFFSGLFGGDDEPPASVPSSFYDDIDTGDHDQFSWKLAGYMHAGGDYASGDYHNFDPASPEARVQIENFHGWDFLPEADYVVVKVTTATGTYYTTIGGPFNDYDDLYDAIADWWESGS